ncbi:alpha/beta hydrolase [Corynebacterium ammoniagenes]|uniref:Hydrolase, alpha/beta domain protein n=1 Tax=Corynebacterium ammoniagenes DSM 20306 TaxID=649754 RepID=A0ABP2IFQ2_CORAM|nr:alpha/beta fold hydrolase [Corynebacterium ammoniagenes]APT83289.1 carboxylesterase [Corynebacterium ammoniagenes DSM 20306]AQS74305.1 carboxylesterase [Corynebacterium ammoniagenes]EFG81466.1 hydrolase, alpha/beta domain protein [Corynebacterium ammoniagenes DSM 20306]
MAGNPRRGIIIATHGVGYSATDLHDLAAHYREDFLVYLVDLAGHGLAAELTESQRQNQFHATATQFEKDLAQILNQSPSGIPVILMGHSLGGAVAAYVATHNALLADALVLEDPAILTAAEAKAHNAEYSFSYGATDETIWPNLIIPTLVIAGDSVGKDNELIFTHEHIQELQQFPLVETTIVSGASHLVRHDNPEGFFAAADAFLDDVLSKSITSTGKKKPFVLDSLQRIVDVLPPQTTWDVVPMRETTAKRNRPYPFAPGISATEFHTTDGDAQPQTVRVVAADDIHNGSTQPIVVFFCVHGGGYVGGKPEYDDVRHEALVQAFQPAVAVSPDYRLAPENPYPAGVQDAIAALIETARRYPNVPIIAYGDSAGAGTLAQAFARLEEFARADAALLRQHVTAFIAVEPCLDPAMQSASWTTYADGPIWYDRASEAAWAGYLPENTDHHVKPSLVQLIPTNPELLPPTLVVVNPVDPLRDEGIDWARRFTDAGVITELHWFKGTVHGLCTIPGTDSWESLVQLIARFTQIPSS